jgi:hypothetical protein
MEEAMSEEGQEENRQEDCQQDLLGNSLDAFGVHGHRTQEAAECVKRNVAAEGGEKQVPRLREPARTNRTEENAGSLRSG